MTSGFDGSDFDDASLFSHLDDPNPPALGGEALTGVMARGQQIRRRRSTMYAGSGAAAMVLIAGTAIAVAASGGSPNGDGNPNALNSVTPSVTHSGHGHTSKPNRTNSPGSSSSVYPDRGGNGSSGQGGHTGGRGGAKPTGTGCVTTTPTPIDTSAPQSTPTTTDAPTPADTPAPPETTPTPVVSCPPTSRPTAEPTPSATATSIDVLPTLATP